MVDINKYLDALIELVLAEFKLVYHKSILGLLWAFLSPLLTMLTFFVIFSFFINLDILNYPFFLLLGILTWNFFNSSTTACVNALELRKSLIKSINFPRELIIFSIIITFILSLIFYILIFFVLMLLFNLNVELITLIQFPLLVIPLIIFATGISLALSVLQTKFRDIQYIWGFISGLLFFITPVFYSVSMVPNWLMPLYLLNPLAVIITELRNITLFEANINLSSLFLVYVIVLVTLFLGHIIFKKIEPSLGEE